MNLIASLKLLFSIPWIFPLIMNLLASESKQEQHQEFADPYNYDVKYYHLDISVSNTTTYLTGSVLMDALAILDIDEIQIDLNTVIPVDSIYLNGEKAQFSHQDDLVKIQSPETITSGQKFRTEIYYKGSSASNSFFSGISTGSDGNYEVHCSQVHVE